MLASALESWSQPAPSTSSSSLPAAVSAGDVDRVLRMLTDEGRPDAATLDRLLFDVAMGGNANMAALLLAHGANPASPQMNGMNALTMASDPVVLALMHFRLGTAAAGEQERLARSRALDGLLPNVREAFLHRCSRPASASVEPAKPAQSEDDCVIQ